MLRLDDQLCFALYAAANAIMDAYRPELAALHLTYPQYLVMLVLWQDGASAEEEIARRLRLRPTEVAPLIAQLEQAGYVRRARSGVDRAASVIVMTQLGTQLEDAAIDAQRQVACQTGMTDQSLAQMRSELHGLIDRIAATGGVSRGEL